MNTIIQAKNQIRQQLKERLSAHANDSGAMSQFLSPLLSRTKGPVAAFMANQHEPNLKPLVESLALDWVFPKVVDNGLRFYRSALSDMKPGYGGLLEPQDIASEHVEMAHISCVLVPGLGFDRRGFRIGRGKGFYDRALENHKGIKIGICYSSAVLEDDLPKEDHDVPMDWLVTESFVLKPLAN